MSSIPSTDVLVVGGGPAGCATAIRLARTGHDVTLVERATESSAPVPRGDLLVPAAVWELTELGIDPQQHDVHPVLGSRLCHDTRALPIRWSDTAGRHHNGLVWRRDSLDAAMRARAVAAGVDVRTGAQADAPIVERGFVRGASVSLADGTSSDIDCRFLVVADGANSAFGRGLGTNRDRQWPYAVSASTCVDSERASDSWIETHLGIADANGNPITGHGWVHPLGNGTLNVGVTVLSSYRDVLGINVVKLLDSFADSMAARWKFDPAQRLVEPMRRRTPVGGSVSPTMGATFLVVGDAAGMANPFTSHGVRSALATGQVAADVLDEALSVGNSTTLQRYPALLSELVGEYHKVGRLSARFLGRPWLLRTALATGMRSESVMGAALRLATNELRDDDRGGAERAYALARVITRFAPSW